MPTSRRNFIGLAAGGFASAAMFPPPASAAPPIAAVALDALAVFDSRPIAALAEEIVPGHGAHLLAAWRGRQFEYTWLRTLMGRYQDFWQVTSDALVFAARALEVDLGDADRATLMRSYLELKAWPDALPALSALKAAGTRIALLTNFTARMADAAAANSGLAAMLEPPITTDRVRAFKPAPRAYAMAQEAFGLRRERIAFAAFAGWDAAGAKTFGYPTFWVNRAGAPAETLGPSPDGIGADLHDLVRFVNSRR